MPYQPYPSNIASNTGVEDDKLDLAFWFSAFYSRNDFFHDLQDEHKIGEALVQHGPVEYRLVSLAWGSYARGKEGCSRERMTEY
jgi:hypothetical protein